MHQPFNSVRERAPRTVFAVLPVVMFLAVMIAWVSGPPGFHMHSIPTDSGEGTGGSTGRLTSDAPFAVGDPFARNCHRAGAAGACIAVSASGAGHPLASDCGRRTIAVRQPVARAEAADTRTWESGIASAHVSFSQGNKAACSGCRPARSLPNHGNLHREYPVTAAAHRLAARRRRCREATNRTTAGGWDVQRGT